MKVLFYFSVFFLLSLIGAVFIATILYPDSDWSTEVQYAMQGPSFFHWFGRDSLGRDLLLRTVHGARMTLLVGVVGSFLSLFFGVFYGGIAAWRGGATDLIMMRIMDVLMSLPHIVTIGLGILALSPKPADDSSAVSAIKLSLAISLGSWMIFARLTRNLVMKEKSLVYVESAVAIGSPSGRIFWREMGPNIVPSLVTMLGLQIPNFLLFEGLLSFMGMGIRPPSSSWGLLLQDGWKFLSSYPHGFFFPALVLFLSIFSFNIIFDDFRRRILRSFEPVDIYH